MKSSFGWRLGFNLIALHLWTSCWTFTDLAALTYGLAAAVFYMATARSRAARIGLTVVAVLFAAIFIYELPALFPLETRIKGASFVDAPLTDVLHHVARQRTSSPSWRFLLCDEAAAAAVVSVEIPDGCALREALARVARAARCEYTWNWWKGCGTAARPGTAEFRFRRIGVPVKKRWDAIVIVDAHGAFP